MVTTTDPPSSSRMLVGRFTTANRPLIDRRDRQQPVWSVPHGGDREHDRAQARRRRRRRTAAPRDRGGGSNRTPTYLPTPRTAARDVHRRAGDGVEPDGRHRDRAVDAGTSAGSALSARPPIGTRAPACRERRGHLRRTSVRTGCARARNRAPQARHQVGDQRHQQHGPEPQPIGLLDLVDDAGEVAELRQQEVHDQHEHHERERCAGRGRASGVNCGCSTWQRSATVCCSSFISPFWCCNAERVAPLRALSWSTGGKERTGSTPRVAIAVSTARSTPR